MNYLAHAYLSFYQEEILVGNMISDYVKGKKKYDYSTGIQKGINLHRAIDTFTDYHEITKTARQFFKPAAGLYAGAFMDVVYDHFLALDKNEFKDDGELHSFAATTYEQLEKYLPVCPERFQRTFPYMKKYDWLYHYQFKKGIKDSMGGLVRRTAYLTDSDAGLVYALFEENYETLKNCYQSFFPALKKFVLGQPELSLPDSH